MEEKAYISLENLKVYKLSRELSRTAWKIYQQLSWQLKKILGDQYIESTDSTGANIAVGYGRFHYLDKVKFYYNARGSLLESYHWYELLVERNLVEKNLRDVYFEQYRQLGPGLNALISSVRKNKYSKP